jgi:hypothetical protein
MGGSQCPLCPQKQTLELSLEMSALCGGLKWSTQHFISDARDGVDGRWVEDIFEGSTRWPRRSCGTAGAAHSQFNRVARQLNERSRETLGFETRAERDLMLVLHRPIEPTVISGHFAKSRRCPLYPKSGHRWVSSARPLNARLGSPMRPKRLADGREPTIWWGLPVISRKPSDLAVLSLIVLREGPFGVGQTFGLRTTPASIIADQV